MKAALILLLIATALALCGRASLRKASRDGDGGMGAAMGGLVLVILSIAFGLIAVLKGLW